MQLNKIQDPRRNIEKARRHELVLFAKAHGVKEIKPDMPATLIRKILTSKGLTDIRITQRTLGQNHTLITGIQPSSPKKPKKGEDHGYRDTVETIDADEDLMRQYEAEHAANVVTAVDDMTIQQLRAECKKRGIKSHRSQKADDLREILNGIDAS
jgi:hypothetical protein